MAMLIYNFCLFCLFRNSRIEFLCLLITLLSNPTQTFMAEVSSSAITAYSFMFLTFNMPTYPRVLDLLVLPFTFLMLSLPNGVLSFEDSRCSLSLSSRVLLCCIIWSMFKTFESIESLSCASYCYRVDTRGSSIMLPLLKVSKVIANSAPFGLL